MTIYRGSLHIGYRYLETERTKTPKTFLSTERGPIYTQTPRYSIHAVDTVYMPRLLRFDSRRGFGVAKGAELDEDGHVFDHGAQGANQPGEVDKQVLFFLRVEEDLRMLAKYICDNIF
jgi:hypothetical protein